MKIEKKVCIFREDCEFRNEAKCKGICAYVYPTGSSKVCIEYIIKKFEVQNAD